MTGIGDYEGWDALEDALEQAMAAADEDDWRDEWPGLLDEVRSRRQATEERARRTDPIEAILDDGALPETLYAHYPRSGYVHHAVALEPFDARPNYVILRPLCRRWRDTAWRERIVSFETWDHLIARASEHTQMCERCVEKARRRAEA